MNADLSQRLGVRKQLRARIESTVAHISQRAADRTAEALVDEVQADAEEMAVIGFATGLAAALGPAMGAAVLADLTGHLPDSDAEIARRFGVRPQAVGRVMRRVRGNLGLPLRQPQKARKAVSEK